MFPLCAGGVRAVGPSGGERCRRRHRGHRLQVGIHVRAVSWTVVLDSPWLKSSLCFPSHWFRLQEPGSLQRISSRRRKRPRVSRQDTTESEDDGGRSHRSHRWNLRLGPDRAQSRTILEVQLQKNAVSGLSLRCALDRIAL